MTAKMTNKLGLCVSAIARKFGYVSQKKAALGFAEGWYMHNERAAACWQSVEEAFANSELQDSLSENIEFRKGELTQFYFNSLPPIEKLSFSKCIGQKEGFAWVPVDALREVLHTAGDALMDERTSSVFDRDGTVSTWYDHYHVAEQQLIGSLEAQEPT